MLDEDACALERLLRRRHTLGGMLLNADMFDRWGPKEGPEFDAMAVESAAAGREHETVTAQLAARVAETRARAPESVRAWANAHVELLERFVATYTSEPTYATNVFVARQEADQWREVAEGKRAFVEENVFYVHVDADQHAEFFGVLGG